MSYTCPWHRCSPPFCVVIGSLHNSKNHLFICF
nr:MAG TPA: hypothetical protein [Bacteriophage sp.]